MRAYKANPMITKELFVAETRRHREMDAITQGIYEKYVDGQFKGCAVGCAIQTINLNAGLDLSHEYHGAYEVYLGIPPLLARLEDRIFEGLPEAEAKDWPVRFAEAIPDGADLSGVWNKFAPWILREIALPSVRCDNDIVPKVIERVARGYETSWADDTPQEASRAADADAHAAHAVADTDADAATVYAAYAAAAAAAADAYAAVYAAYASAAAAAADAAAAYAAADARKNAFKRMAEKLIELMAEAPV